MKVIIVGGGAAGFFAAFSCRQHHPNAEITILEKTSKLLSKVKISGGGRCNVTNHTLSISELVKHYPRGSRFLKKAFPQFSVKDTIAWFEQNNVALKTEADLRMFPSTDDSQTIINLFLYKCQKDKIAIHTRCGVSSFKKQANWFIITTELGKLEASHLIIATGGHSSAKSYEWIQQSGHQVIPPVPSLFTFNIPDHTLHHLQGLSVEHASVKILGSKYEYSGPLLITHWGVSGPAVLKLSAFGARTLEELDYQYNFRINWINNLEEKTRQLIEEKALEHPKKKMINEKIGDIPKRLWEHLLVKSGVNEHTWGEIGKKTINRLSNILTNDQYQARGKTTFKEEFVTAGGIDLKEVNPTTMQSRRIKGLYFCGEVLDIDGITGGFNFQAAWTTGFVAGKLND